MVEKGMSVIKYLMFFFNFLFWLSGLALIIVGAYIKEKYGDYFSYADDSFATAPIFIIIVGCIVFIIGFLGCCGAIKENYCMVTTFSVLLGIIFVLEIVAGALGFAYKKKVEDKVKDALQRAVDRYSTEKGAKDLLDWAQQKFECCGNKNGTSDYTGLSANDTCQNGGVASCYKDDKCGTAAELYKENCVDGFIDFVEHNLVVIGGVAIGIAFIQLLGIIFACCLMKAIKGEYEVV